MLGTGSLRECGMDFCPLRTRRAQLWRPSCERGLDRKKTKKYRLSLVIITAANARRQRCLLMPCRLLPSARQGLFWVKDPEAPLPTFFSYVTPSQLACYISAVEIALACLFWFFVVHKIFRVQTELKTSYFFKRLFQELLLAQAVEKLEREKARKNKSRLPLGPETLRPKGENP